MGDCDRAQPRRGCHPVGAPPTQGGPARRADRGSTPSAHSAGGDEMTTHDDVSAKVPTDATPENPPAADPAEQSIGTGAGVICEAEVVDIGLAGTGTDPFDATFLLAAADPHGREIVVW